LRALCRPEADHYPEAAAPTYHENVPDLGSPPSNGHSWLPDVQEPAPVPDAEQQTYWLQPPHHDQLHSNHPDSVSAGPPDVAVVAAVPDLFTLRSEPSLQPLLPSQAAHPELDNGYAAQDSTPAQVRALVDRGTSACCRLDLTLRRGCRLLGWL
jgi:hypothetical protein